MFDCDCISGEGYCDKCMSEVRAERDTLLQTLAKERDEFGKRETDLIKEIRTNRDAVDYWRGIAKKMTDYVAHEQSCIRVHWEAGESTKDGGYRTKYRGKWYQSTPVDETPKCECGADDLIALYDEAAGK